MQLSSYNLKVIAIVSMVIDHIGIIFFPQVIVFRIIGRIAFPIFAFLIAEGSRKTSSKLRYSLRLLMFAFISYIPYNILFYNQIYRPEGESLNIFFTLFFGLILIFSWKYFSNIVLKIFSVISILLFSFAINLDYGIYGVF